MTVSTPSEIEQLARDYFACVDARDGAGMERYWAPRPTWEIVALGEQLDGDQARAFFAELFAALPDLRTTVEQVTASERTSAVQWRMTGTFAGGAFLGLAATGRAIELRGCDCLEWEDRQLVRNTVYYDGLTFARGAGMLPAAGTTTERALYAAFNALTAVRRLARAPGRSK